MRRINLNIKELTKTYNFLMFYVYKDREDENFVPLDQILEVIGYKVINIDSHDNIINSEVSNDIKAYYDLEVEEIGINPESRFDVKLKEV